VAAYPMWVAAQESARRQVVLVAQATASEAAANRAMEHQALS
jgi:hypothetical protein